MIKLNWSDTFIKKVKRLVRQNPQLHPLIMQKLEKLAENPFDPSLRTHKLKGDLAGKWSFSLDYSNRIIFKFITNPESLSEEILLLTIGSHDEVY